MSKWEKCAEIDPLTQLAIKYGTDKWGPHFYTPVYHELFSKLRPHPIHLLGGSSLAMWAEYFPTGQITGVDNAEMPMPSKCAMPVSVYTSKVPIDN
jgi:hypothetical protein